MHFSLVHKCGIRGRWVNSNSRCLFFYPLAHWRCGSNFKVWFSNLLWKRGDWALTMKLLSGEYHTTTSIISPFLRRAMNSGTCITGQLRQPTTSLHTWPITWDIKGCLCLFKQNSPKHTPDWLNYVYFTTILTKKQSSDWIHKKNAI